MAIDVVDPSLLTMVLVGIAVLAIVAISAKDRSGIGFLGLGAKRIACGYLGALAALLVYSILEAVLVGLNSIERGVLLTDRAPASIAGWSIQLFLALAPIVVFAVAAGLLLMRVLAGARLVSLLGALFIALCYAGARAYAAHATPDDPWCAAHLVACTSRQFLESLLIAASVAVGFALAAGLPVVRSPRLDR